MIRTANILQCTINNGIFGINLKLQQHNFPFGVIIDIHRLGHRNNFGNLSCSNPLRIDHQINIERRIGSQFIVAVIFWFAHTGNGFLYTILPGQHTGHHVQLITFCNSNE